MLSSWRRSRAKPLGPPTPEFSGFLDRYDVGKMKALFQHLTADFLHHSRLPLMPGYLVLVGEREPKNKLRYSPRSYVDYPAARLSIVCGHSQSLAV